MEEIRKLFLGLSGDYPKVVILLILEFIDPVDTFFNPSLKKVVNTMTELKQFYCLEFDKNNNC